MPRIQTLALGVDETNTFVFRTVIIEDAIVDMAYWPLPRFRPGPGYDLQLNRADMRLPVLGGRSKRDQLGSVAESWGSPHIEGRMYGMFQVEADPPSRSTSPFKNSMIEDSEPAKDILVAKLESLRLARAGTAYEGSETFGQSPFSTPAEKPHNASSSDRRSSRQGNDLPWALSREPVDADRTWKQERMDAHKVLYEKLHSNDLGPDGMTNCTSECSHVRPPVIPPIVNKSIPKSYESIEPEPRLMANRNKKESLYTASQSSRREGPVSYSSQAEHISTLGTLDSDGTIYHLGYSAERPRIERPADVIHSNRKVQLNATKAKIKRPDDE